MTNGNGQTPPPAESRIAGPVGDISKLLQTEAPEALESAELDPQDMTRAPRAEREPPALPDDDRSDPAEELGELTAAELAAEQAAAAEKPDAHDTELAVDGLSVGDVAEKLGLDARKLYEELQIPLREGRGSVSLSELKQGYQDAALLDDAREKLTEEQTTHSNDVMVARQELSQVVELLGRVMVEEVGQEAASQKLAELYGHARGQAAEFKERESQALFARFPEWRDPDKRKAVRDEMLEHLQPFGFHAIDVDSTLDHRLLAYVAANMERDRRIAATREKLGSRDAPKGQRAPAARRRGPSEAALSKDRLTRRAKATGRREDMIPAIGALIAGQEK
jgi:hypothetical protein